MSVTLGQLILGLALVLIVAFTIWASVYIIAGGDFWPTNRNKKRRKK